MTHHLSPGSQTERPVDHHRIGGEDMHSAIGGALQGQGAGNTLPLGNGNPRKPARHTNYGRRAKGAHQATTCQTITTHHKSPTVTPPENLEIDFDHAILAGGA